MNAKQIKYLSLFEQMVKADATAEATVKKFLPQFITLDFQLAVDTWEYLCTTHEDEIAKSEKLGTLMGGVALDCFYSKASQKAVKAVFDTPVLRRAVYQYSPEITDGAPFTMLCDALAASKVAPAEDVLKCVVKNNCIEYGPFMKKLLERVFIEILKKSTSKKLELNRKLATLLLSYVSKIKTDERAMLEQRIRETI